MTDDDTTPDRTDRDADHLTCRLCTTGTGALFIATRSQWTDSADLIPVCRTHANMLEEGMLNDLRWDVYALLEAGSQGLDANLTQFALDVVDWVTEEVQAGREGPCLDRLDALRDALAYEHSKFPVDGGSD